MFDTRMTPQETLAAVMAYRRVRRVPGALPAIVRAVNAYVTITRRAASIRSAVKQEWARVRVLALAISVRPGAHLHVDYSGRDCDGSSSTWHVSRRNLRGQLLEALTRWVDLGYSGDPVMVPFWVRVDGRTVSYGHETEEGYTATDLTLCYRDCGDSRGQYDQYAEQAGY